MLPIGRQIRARFASPRASQKLRTSTVALLAIRRERPHCRTLTAVSRHLAAVQLFVAQGSAGLTFTGSIDCKQPRILWRPVPANCPGRNLHDVASVRLDRHAAGLYEQLALNHEVVFAMWMLIGPGLRCQFPLKQRRLRPTALHGWRDDL